MLRRRSHHLHHHCCSFDLIPLTSADLSRRRGEEQGQGKAYYPDSSALNYLNANDVRGRERGEGGGGRLRGGEIGRREGAEGGQEEDGRRIIICSFSWLFLKAGYLRRKLQGLSSGLLSPRVQTHDPAPSTSSTVVLPLTLTPPDFSLLPL